MRLSTTLKRIRTHGCDFALAVVGASAISCGLTAQPAAADAPVANDAPIKIERCAVTIRSVLQDPFNGLRAEFATGLAIRFLNLRRVTATAVRISVRYQGSSETIAERGAFAGGVPIERTFATFAGNLSGGESAACRVTSVTFADGTQWNE